MFYGAGSLKKSRAYMSAIIRLAVLAVLVTTLSGCDVIEGIFKIGFWSGIIVVAVILAVLFFVVRLFRRRV